MPQGVIMRITVLIVFISFCQCIEFNASPRNFSIELLYNTQKALNGHVVISPFGIWTLMTGLTVGATGNSFEQLRRALILPTNLKTVVTGYRALTKAVLKQQDGVLLTSKNFVFAGNDFVLNPLFKKTIEEDFGSTVKVLDFKNPFKAANEANQFIQDSGARVSNVLSSGDFEASRMILTNVISFKGLWTVRFNARDTKLENFYSEDKKILGKVNMMYQRGEFPVSSIPELKATVCELTYGTGKYSMLVILPHPDTTLQDVYKQLAYVTLTDIIAKLKQDAAEYGLDEVEIKLPRFKISANLVMNKPLNDMGVYDIFEPDLASFGRITKEKIFVSAIVHKADIEVTEEGTVAAASTKVDLSDRISSQRLTANKPFLYFIIERTTTTVIFSGMYSKPNLF